MRRLRSLPGLVAALALGTLICGVLTYAQWHVNETCVTLSVCLVEGSIDAEPVACKDNTCGFTIWVFAGPGLAFAAATAVAGVLWGRRAAY